MAETIKTILTADAGQLRAEFERAGQATEQWSKKTKAAAGDVRNLGNQAYRAGRGGMSGSFGFLAFSQAVEDAQYGVKGVLNNIPQMVIGFGGGMGLAGAISLAAVAAASLYPKLKDLYGVTDNENLKKAADEWAKVFAEGMKVARTLEENNRRAQEMADLSEQIRQSLSERANLHGQMTGYYDAELKSAQDRRDVELEILEARRQLAIATGGSGLSIAGQIQNTQNQGMGNDLVNREKELANLQSEQMQKQAELDNMRAEADAAAAAAMTRRVELTKNLAGAQANLAGAESAVSSHKGRGGKVGLMADETEARKKRDAVKAELAAVTAAEKVRADAYADEIKALSQNIDGLDEKINKTYQEKLALEELIKTRREIQDIETRTDQANQWSAWQDAISKGHQDAVKMKIAATEAGQKLREMAQPDEAQQKAQQKARADFTSELIVLKLRADGRREAADAWERETALRRDAGTLAKDMNISDAKALQLLREKQKLIERAAAADGGGRRGIRRSSRDTLGFGPSGLEGRGGFLRDNLRNDALRRRAAERGGKPQSADPLVRQLERSTNLQEQMLRVFQNLGIA